MNAFPPNDPLYPRQWHLNNTGQSGGSRGVDINLGNVWGDYTGRGVVVAVQDDGVDLDHPDLVANIRPDLSFSTFAGDPGGGNPINPAKDSHGTAVAGLIAATTNNGLGVAGVAPGAQLAAVTIDLGQNPTESPNADGTQGFLRAVNDHDVSNNSWGRPGFTNFNSPFFADEGRTIPLAARNGRGGLGTVILFASGNDRLEGEDSNSSNNSNSPYVIAVAAIGHNGRVASYSSPGTNILVGAPSQDIIYANVDTDGDGVPDSQEEDQPANFADDPSDPQDQPGSENPQPGDNEPIQQTANGGNPPGASDDPTHGGVAGQDPGAGGGGEAQRPGSARALVELERVGGMVTTAPAGFGTTPSGGPGGDYDFGFGGTSAATPVTSGVTALLLEANPRLGYRDVQDILTLSARNSDTSASWTINAASNWNGGGMHVNRDVGYGLIDAQAAVRLAETWTSQSTAANMLSSGGQAVVAQPIPGGGQTLTSSITVPAGVQVERAEAVLHIDHPRASDLDIRLISPSGTSSQLLKIGQQVAIPFPAEPMSLTSTHYLGENAGGAWTVSLTDTRPDAAQGVLQDWAIVLHGKDASARQTYFYTNEYQYYAARDPSRRLLDAQGDIALNASPVTSDSLMNLAPGSVSRLDQTPLILGPQTQVRSYYGGDGNDIVTGNNLGGIISTGRGNDTILPGAGDDILDGGPGNNTVLLGGSITDHVFLLQGADRQVQGPGGTDVLRNIDTLRFADAAAPVTSIDFIQRSSLFGQGTLTASGLGG